MSDAPAAFLKLPAAHAKRLAWALRESGDLLAEALRKDTSAEARAVEKLPEGQIPAQVVNLIIEKADPTQNKGMTAWLAKQYARGDLRLEDLGTANETLTMFQRYAPRLGPGQRDLGRYPHLAAVWEAVIGFANDEEQRLSGKAQKALDKGRAYAESRILRQDEDGFTIAVPLTEFAAKWWGKGTRWCTAAEKDNMFLEYHHQAPLIIFTIPELGNHGKLQLWVEGEETEFRLSDDRPVGADFIAQHWSRFQQVIRYLVTKNGRNLCYTPEEMRNEELCRMAVEENGAALRHVPARLRTLEICKIAVKQDGEGLALDLVPEEHLTQDLYEIAVSRIGTLLRSVPVSMRTDELCRTAIAQDGLALQCVPEALRTEEMCRVAVSQNGRALQWVPEQFQTEELCRIAVTQDGCALEWVPYRFRSYELCKTAVRQHGYAVRYVPEGRLSPELCEIAVKHRSEALQFVPRSLLTQELCNLAASINGWVIRHVPEGLRSDDFLIIAASQYGNALMHVPETRISRALSEIAVRKSGVSLAHVPTKLLTKKLCKIAVAQNGRALKYVPKALRTKDLCKIAVKQTGRAIEFVPKELRQELLEFCRYREPSWELSVLDKLASFMQTPCDVALSELSHG
jgi:hypothetical protein